MSETAHTSDSEIDDPNKITDAATCLDYLKRREVFLYKMMNDPSHKAMLYFLEVLMNSDSPITVDQLAARFSHKSFSLEMREACGGGSAEGLKEFLQRYPSLFNVKPNGQVTSVAIELPGLDSNFDSLSDQESCSLKENGQKSMSDNLSDISTSFRNLTPAAVNSAYSSKTCPSGNNLQKENAYNRFPPYRKLNSISTDTSSNTHHQNSTNNTTSRLNSTSSLSLVSSQSGSPLNTPSSDHIFGRKKPSNNFVNSNNNTTNTSNSTSNPSPHSLSSGNPPAGRTKPSNIYTPPQLRNLDQSSQLIIPSNCELCSSNPAATTNRNSSNHPTNHHEITTVASGTCIHCPLLELACHHTHHCTTAHHHTSTHCHCTPTALTPTASSFHHYHHPLHHIPAQASLRSPPVLLPNFYSLPPMEKLFLESEAVHFFQQKLIKREERWVPIKSLAGHLSQATPEVRAIVGPQLEFRRFLLKHPHVFEVQGELVSVKEPFLTTGLGGLPLKRSRDRLSAVHASHSSTNISNSPAYVSRNMSYEKNPRPKSLILPNMMTFGHLADVNNSYVPSSIQRSTNSSNHYRRSAHFAVDNSSTATPSARSLIQSDNINSAPTTPTTANLVFADSNHSQVDKVANEKSASNPVPRLHHNHHNGVTSSTMTTEYDTSVITNSLSSTTVNSLSLTMTANEYRAIMFLRKVLEKQGGAVGQSGLSLHNLMQFLSTKAPEAVQTTIGWTKIELEEFLSQHNLFFELKPVSVDNDEKTPAVDSANTEKQKQTVNSVKIEDNIAVCNRRLNRMINIIITASKSSDANGVRTLTNRCGRIFHVAKLWGIIDLGKHEHVFFDKSIFRHVDDLQKHFKIDELLYFNAVLAPKESRAKWRATHVWKECDRENVEKFGALSKMNPTHMRKQNTSNTNRNFISLQNTHNLHELDYQHVKGSKLSREIATDTMDYPIGNSGTGNHTPVVDDDDTEVEEEIEDYIVENSTSKDRELGKSHPSQLDNDSDCEYALAGEEGIDDDEEEEEDDDGDPVDSPIAHLPIDIKFIADEVEEEMERVLNIQLKSTTITNDNKKTEDDLHNLSNTTKSSCHELCDSSNSTELSHQTQSEPCRMMTMKKNSGSNTSSDYERHYSLVTSSTGQSKLIRHKLNLSSQDDSGTSSSLSEMNAISIAVQTVSTGDIMATQLYHDNKE